MASTPSLLVPPPDMQARRAEVVEHLEGVEGGLANPLGGHETEHLAERERSRSLLPRMYEPDGPLDSSNTSDSTQYENTPSGGVLPEFLSESSFIALEDEADVPVVVHAREVVARAAALARVRRVPLGVERHHRRGRVAAAGDVADAGVVVVHQAGGVRRGAARGAARIDVRRGEGHPRARALAVLQEGGDRGSARSSPARRRGRWGSRR